MTKRDFLSSFLLVHYEHENKLISIFVALFASPTHTNLSINEAPSHHCKSHLCDCIKAYLEYLLIALVTKHVTKKESLGLSVRCHSNEIFKVSHPFKWCFFYVSSVSKFALTISRQVLDLGALQKQMSVMFSDRDLPVPMMAQPSIMPSDWC